MASDPVTIALIGALGGGVAVKFVEGLFGRGNKKMDDAASIRKEQREEMAELRTIVKDLQKEVADWKDKYYQLLEKHIVLKGEHTDLKADHEQMKLQLKVLTGEVKEVKGQADATDAGIASNNESPAAE
jgi:chromosome segregation ATPase